MPLYWKSKYAFEDHSTTGILSAVSASKREEVHENVPTVLMTRLKLEEIKATHAVSLLHRFLSLPFSMFVAF